MEIVSQDFSTTGRSKVTEWGSPENETGGETIRLYVGGHEQEM